MTVRRLWVDKGHLLQMVDVGILADVEEAVGLVTFALELPLFLPNGSPTKMDYRGPGFTTKDEQGQVFLTLGDAHNPSAILSDDYLIGEAVNVKERDEFVAGFLAGATAKKRLIPSKSQQWRDGYKEGLPFRRVRIQW